MTSQIRVDLQQLRESCTAVRHDTEHGLRPGLNDTANKIQHGVRFGRSSPSGEAQAATEALIATLKRHRENSQRHLDTAEVLTTVLDRVLEQYSRSDASVEVNINKVLAEVEAALPADFRPSTRTSGLLP